MAKQEFTDASGGSQHVVKGNHPFSCSAGSAVSPGHPVPGGQVKSSLAKRQRKQCLEWIANVSVAADCSFLPYSTPKAIKML